MIVEAFAGPQMHRCNTCRRWKSHDQFGLERRVPSGLPARCRTCRSERRREHWRADPDHRQRRLDTANRWRENHRGAWLAANRMYKTGVCSDDFDALLAAQGGGCAVCGAIDSNGRGLHLDHDHASGRVRGVLCDLHNRGIGYFQDDPALLVAAAEYLRRYL